jgi:biotin carboxyl carrier protein
MREKTKMKYKVRLNDRIYEVEVEQGNAILVDEYDAIAKNTQNVTVNAPVAEAPQKTAAAVSSNTASADAVKSPLPGVVMDVKVSVGQTVKKGDVVVLIEAMKMENEINASKDGKITAVYVNKGSKVEQGTPLYAIS